MDNKLELDKLTQEKLNGILAQEIGSLEDGDKAFLRARRSYLTEEELERYASILEDVKEEVVIEKPKKKTKKK